ncbi:cytochrome P450 [Pisolithus sp. B1]|nr:cytochrome P450 [Pisolithus sp. B1]
MVLHPVVQRKAQEETLHVVGTDRLPDFGDRLNLPYAQAILLETIRWVPVVPIVARMSLHAIIIPHVWAMTQDQGRCPESKVFSTHRCSRNLKTSLYSPLGVCPGRHLANQSLWAVIVSTLATLQIGKATDDSGAEMENSPKFKSGPTMHSRIEMRKG